MDCFSSNDKHSSDLFLENLNKVYEEVHKKYPRAFLKHAEWYANQPLTWNFYFEQQDFDPKKGLTVYNFTVKSHGCFVGQPPATLGDPVTPSIGYYAPVHVDQVTVGPDEAQREARTRVVGHGWDLSNIDLMTPVGYLGGIPQYQVLFKHLGGETKLVWVPAGTAKPTDAPTEAVTAPPHNRDPEQDHGHGQHDHEHGDHEHGDHEHGDHQRGDHDHDEHHGQHDHDHGHDDHKHGGGHEHGDHEHGGHDGHGHHAPTKCPSTAAPKPPPAATPTDVKVPAPELLP